MVHYLFSYGTLQRDDVQLKLFGRKLNCFPDVLVGYKTAVVEITDNSFLSKGENKNQQTLVRSGNMADNISGMVLEMSEAELYVADSYEPEGYQRTMVVLGSGRKAWVYQLTISDHKI